MLASAQYRVLAILVAKTVPDRRPQSLWLYQVDHIAIWQTP